MLEPFHQGRVLRAALALRIPPLYAPLIVFTAYWGIPLALLASSSWFITDKAIEGQTRLYLSDLTHLLYAVLISCGALPVYEILRKTSPVVRHTLRVAKGKRDHEHWKQKYRRYQKAAFSWWIIAVCAAVSGGVTLTILLIVFGSSYAGWWGHISHGYAGIYFALIASQMVFWGMWSFFVVAASSVVISHIARCKFSYEPLRADGCNGLRPVGLLIMLMWCYSLLTALAIFVVFSRGYLGLEHNPLIWFIGLAATLCLPFVAILPLSTVTMAIYRARELYLLKIERRAKRISFRTREGVETMSQLFEIRQTVLRSNIFPFRYRAVLVLSAINFAQFLASAREMLPR